MTERFGMSGCHRWRIEPASVSVAVFASSSQDYSAMLPSEGPVHYVRRREKTFGPFTTKQILKGTAQAKFLESDLIATSQDGPWRPIRAYVGALTGPSKKQEPPVVPAIAGADAAPPGAGNIPTACLVEMSPSPRKAMSGRAIALLAGGLIAMVGLVVIFALALIVAAPQDSSREVAAEDRGAPLDSLESAVAVENVEPTPVTGDAGEKDAEELLRVMRDLQAVLQTPSSNAASAQANEGSDVGSETGVTLGSWQNKLSDDLRALTADEATDLAVRYMGPAEREANGQTAFWLLNKAAEEGNGRAMYLLFICYSKGIGVSADQSASLQWLSRAAEAGDASGMLAYSGAIRRGMYDGLGESEAQMWLNRSASVGSPAAINELNRQQAQGAVAAFGAFAAAMGSENEQSRRSQACNGETFLGEPCSCHRFRPLLDGDGFDPTRCGNCQHDKESHNIE